MDLRIFGKLKDLIQEQNKNKKISFVKLSTKNLKYVPELMQI